MFSFTLAVKSAGYTRSRSSSPRCALRVTANAVRPNESGREALECKMVGQEA
ncbi:hypothetical protein C8R45DRAFT_1211246 [Mycena sanguinolenta]|nr:hypothetical protein C8R45DRAFT_1211246 [Mycena sanguinolenta]